MLEIKITVPEQKLFQVMHMLGSKASKLEELTTIPGSSVEIAAEKINVKWDAETIASLPNLWDDQTGKQSTDLGPG